MQGRFHLVLHPAHHRIHQMLTTRHTCSSPAVTLNTLDSIPIRTRSPCITNPFSILRCRQGEAV
ncbi:hypothetical protein BFW01_g4057 [Lasiodiplodia theobromae]|nr:hypothetical protein BFW01_g4057 [Lasiodiplodia theobromae]